MGFVFILLVLLVFLLFGFLGPPAGTWIMYFILTFCALWHHGSTKPGAKKKFWIFFVLAQLSLFSWVIYEIIQ